VNARARKLPLVCANLFEKKTKKPLVDPYLIKQVGRVKVGIFGLITNNGALGISKDSLTVEEPVAAAQRTIKEMKAKGATVVVLLSQLGRVESEDLVVAVEGIDALIVGRNTPIITNGRMVKNAVACYGGEQGQHMGRTILTIDEKGRSVTGENEVFRLGPEFADKPEVLALVKAFEEGFNEKMRKVEMELEAQQTQERFEDSPNRFLGAELCARCHQDEFEQWKTTSHSLAWQTLVDAKKDATPDCVPCHVVGFKQPGGFHNQGATPDRVNVQCENCHGMGTEHHAFSEPSKAVSEATCVGCHQGENDPEWNWAAKRPKIVHTNSSGETIGAKRTGSHSKSMMKSH
jgi:hypothetical protein